MYLLNLKQVFTLLTGKKMEKYMSKVQHFFFKCKNRYVSVTNVFYPDFYHIGLTLCFKFLRDWIDQLLFITYMLMNLEFP